LLLAFDAIAAGVWAVAPRAFEGFGNLVNRLRYRPGAAFAIFCVFSVAVYLPMRLIFGDAAWLEPGHFPLPIQTSRILLYSGYFLIGIGIGATDLSAGLVAQKRRMGKPLEDMGRLRGAVLWRDPAAGLCAPQLGRRFPMRRHCRGEQPTGSPSRCSARRWRLPSRRCSCALRSRPSNCSMPSSVGLWHLPGALHLHHLAAIRALRSALPALVKFALVFAGTLALSWGSSCCCGKFVRGADDLIDLAVMPDKPGHDEKFANHGFSISFCTRQFSSSAT